MNILIISPTIPWPLDRGNRVRIYNIIKELSKKNDITLISCFDIKNSAEKEAKKILSQLCIDVIFYKRPNSNLLMRLLFKVAAFFSYYFLLTTETEFYTNFFFFKRLVHRYIKTENFDLILTNYWYTVFKPIINAKIPTICDTHDIIWENHLKVIEREEKSHFKYWFLKHLNKELKKREIKILNAHDLLITVNQKDAETLTNESQITNQIKALTHISNSRLEYKFFTRKENKLLFFGAMNSRMNKDAINYFITEILPKLKKILPDIELLIAGSGIGEDLRTLEKKDMVHFLGYQPKLEDIFHSAKIMVMPLRLGSGIKGRILEAMEAGIPVVGSSIAAEGIPITAGKEMIIADTEKDILESIVKLLTNDDYRKNISINARNFFTANYNWENTYGKIHEFLNLAIKNYERSKLNN